VVATSRTSAGHDGLVMERDPRSASSRSRCIPIPRRCWPPRRPWAPSASSASC
jgi:hypothetical protein